MVIACSLSLISLSEPSAGGWKKKIENPNNWKVAQLKCISKVICDMQLKSLERTWNLILCASYFILGLNGGFVIVLIVLTEFKSSVGGTLILQFLFVRSYHPFQYSVQKCSYLFFILSAVRNQSIVVLSYKVCFTFVFSFLLEQFCFIFFLFFWFEQRKLKLRRHDFYLDRKTKTLTKHKLSLWNVSCCLRKYRAELNKWSNHINN